MRGSVKYPQYPEDFPGAKKSLFKKKKYASINSSIKRSFRDMIFNQELHNMIDPNGYHWSNGEYCVSVYLKDDAYIASVAESVGEDRFDANIEADIVLEPITDKYEAVRRYREALDVESDFLYRENVKYELILGSVIIAVSFAIGFLFT